MHLLAPLCLIALVPWLGIAICFSGVTIIALGAGGEVHLAMAFNPSHLEIVSPVVEGSVRARQDRRKDVKGSLVLPILIHGDAAFAGQGVVMETFQLSQTRAYRTGGLDGVSYEELRYEGYGPAGAAVIVDTDFFKREIEESYRRKAEIYTVRDGLWPVTGFRVRPRTIPAASRKLRACPAMSSRCACSGIRGGSGRSPASRNGPTWNGSCATGSTSPGSQAITSSNSTCTTSTSPTG